MRRAAALAVLAALLPALAAHAQTPPAPRPATAPRPAAPAPRAEDPRPAADQVLKRMAGEGAIEKIVAGHRQAMILSLERSGLAPAEAVIIFDSYFLPDYRAGTPGLLVALQDVLIAEFTLPELRSLMENRDSEPRRAAQPRLVAIPARLSEVERAWAARVGAESLQKNRDELRKLGLKIGDAR